MTILAMNLLLALVWLALTGEITPGNFVLGFAAGYAALRVSRGALPESGYFGKVGQLVRFSLFFLWELVKANLRVAYDVLTPRHHMKPAVVAIPLDLETDEEITLLATLITLTPGTLGLDVSRDRRTLYIHAMYVDDVEKTRAEIKAGFERRVMELLR
jgi:multicomponent Na+:H+ antiporter subunit E